MHAKFAIGRSHSAWLLAQVLVKSGVVQCIVGLRGAVTGCCIDVGEVTSRSVHVVGLRGMELQLTVLLTELVCC